MLVSVGTVARPTTKNVIVSSSPTLSIHTNDNADSNGTVQYSISDLRYTICVREGEIQCISFSIKSIILLHVVCYAFPLFV